MNKPRRRYVVCVQSEQDGDLEARKLYEVLPDESAETRGYLRVVDDSGEDYLYPASWFVAVQVPEEAERALVNASPSVTARTR